jgi:hypothetical protein
MGSGSHGPYGGDGNAGGSQPYAPTYHVVPQMMEQDKKDTNIYNEISGYFRNPYATSIQDAIVNDQIKMNGHSAHGTYTYILDENNNIIFAKRYNPNNSQSRAPHPTLVGGKDPVVQCAGMIRFEKGRIAWYNNDNGHFRPNGKSLDKVDAALEKLRHKHPNIFSKNYSGGKNQ